MASSSNPGPANQPPIPDAGSTSSATTAELGGPQYRLLLPPPEQASPPPSLSITTNPPPPPPPPPLVICFHGSGDPPSCSPGWDPLAARLVRDHGLRVLLCDRGPANPGPRDAAAALRAHLLREGEGEGSGVQGHVPGPYVLVAHSYGGAFARTFLHVWEEEEEEEKKGRGRGRGRGERDAMIAGMVLVETGQEGGLDRDVEEDQLRRRVLGRRPLVVVRGNSLLQKWRDLERAEREGMRRDGDDADARRRIEAHREMLRRCDEEDERLKRRQLRLSASRDGSRARFVEIPDCGHNVVRDRPDAVADAVEWVVGMMGDEEQRTGRDRRAWWRMVEFSLLGATRFDWSADNAERVGFRIGLPSGPVHLSSRETLIRAYCEPRQGPPLISSAAVSSMPSTPAAVDFASCCLADTDQGSVLRD
ncbi:Alpha/Beta hydrolase protein [Biscogniauxia mediterranea]|nr:Alpha/Beta hydrolase protein [Biscogniauxia mediterranea]